MGAVSAVLGEASNGESEVEGSKPVKQIVTGGVKGYGETSEGRWVHGNSQ